MASDIKMAETLAKYTLSGMNIINQAEAMLTALAKFYITALEKEDTKRQLLEFYNIGVEEQKKLSPGETLKMISYKIEPEYAKSLYSVLKRDGIAHINTQTNTFDMSSDGKGDTIKTASDSVMIYNTQQEKFMYAVAEAKAISGYEQEIPRNIADAFADKVQSSNPMKEIKDMPYEKYIALRQDIQKLDRDMRFTLFPDIHVDKDTGKKLVDVAFLSKTSQLYDRNGNTRSVDKVYDIEELIKALLVKQKLLEKDSSLNYLETIAQKENDKDKVISDLLSERTNRVEVLKKTIGTLYTDDETKEAIKNIVNSYNKNNATRKDIADLIRDNAENLKDSEKENLLKLTNGLEEDKYIYPVRIRRKDGDLNYQIDTSQYMKLGKDLTISRSGRDDLIISDRDSIQGNLEKQIMGYMEKNSYIERSFVVLTKEEVQKLRRGDIDIIKKDNVLNKENIDFIKKAGRDLVSQKTKKLTDREKRAKELIDEINEKKDKFMLESDQRPRPRTERFEEHPHVIVEEIIREQDHDDSKKEEIDSERDRARSESDELQTDLEAACAEVAAEDVEPVMGQEFDDYINRIVEEQRIIENEKNKDKKKDAEIGTPEVEGVQPQEHPFAEAEK